MTVAEYMDAARGRAWEWGVHDCSAWPAAWAGVELPVYSTADEADLMINAAGGLVALWEHHSKGVAEPVSRDFQAGDVGVIEVLVQQLAEPDDDADSNDEELTQNYVTTSIQIGAIFTGKRWAFIPIGGGIAAVHCEPVKAWRPYCRKHS